MPSLALLLHIVSSMTAYTIYIRFNMYLEISVTGQCQTNINSAWHYVRANPVIQAHKECFISRNLFSYFWQTAQDNFLCSFLASFQPHNVTKSLLHNPFQVPSAIFFTTLRCKVIINFRTAIVLMTYIF